MIFLKKFKSFTHQHEIYELLSRNIHETNFFYVLGTAQHPETLVMFDLLWKYYEKTRNYAAAAKILAKLADRHSTEINLQQRIEYLSRAIICVKSGEICMESHRGGTGQLLHDLEEKMEVARVQLQVLDSLYRYVCEA